jgi:hypothetical protein
MPWTVVKADYLLQVLRGLLRCFVGEKRVSNPATAEKGIAIMFLVFDLSI